jgi:hypothetical protein
MDTITMHSNMNFPAPLAALGFLAACGGVALLSIGTFVALFVRKPKVARSLFLSAASIAVAYLGLVCIFSLVSSGRILARGQEEYFCEIDCHLAYSVTDVKPLPDGASTRYIVTLRTRFDETTISNMRPKDAPLSPSPRSVQLIDAPGNTYPIESLEGVPLTTSLIPGESYTTRLTFRVPPGAQGLRLLIRTTPQWPDHFVIGDENSLLHQKTYLSL